MSNLNPTQLNMVLDVLNRNYKRGKWFDYDELWFDIKKKYHVDIPMPSLRRVFSKLRDKPRGFYLSNKAKHSHYLVSRRLGEGHNEYRLQKRLTDAF